MGRKDKPYVHSQHSKTLTCMPESQGARNRIACHQLTQLKVYRKPKKSNIEKSNNPDNKCVNEVSRKFSRQSTNSQEKNPKLFNFTSNLKNAK